MGRSFDGTLYHLTTYKLTALRSRPSGKYRKTFNFHSQMRKDRSQLVPKETRKIKMAKLSFIFHSHSNKKSKLQKIELQHARISTQIIFSSQTSSSSKVKTFNLEHLKNTQNLKKSNQQKTCIFFSISHNNFRDLSTIKGHACFHPEKG